MYPIPVLDASVSSLIGSCGSKCLSTGPFGLVRMSLTCVIAAPCSSVHMNAFFFDSRPFSGIIACFMSGAKSAN